MKRVISVYLPNWPTERFIRKSRSAEPEPAAPGLAGLDPEPAAAPLILCLRVRNRREVYATDSVARSLGLRVGMTVTKAQALVPGLAIKDAEQEEDGKALERLALWALQLYSPIAAADHPSGLVIDATGGRASLRR